MILPKQRKKKFEKGVFKDIYSYWENYAEYNIKNKKVFEEIKLTMSVFPNQI